MPKLPMHIPPHIGWPVFVVSLLLSSVALAFSALYFAGSDGGAQLVPAYYQQAAQWESHMAQQARNAALGWRVRLTVAPVGDAAGQRKVEIQVLDAQQTPIPDLVGTVTTSRPHRSAPHETQPWQPAAGAGLYTQHLHLAADGLWDFLIVLERDGQRFTHTVRKEVQGA